MKTYAVIPRSRNTVSHGVPDFMTVFDMHRIVGTSTKLYIPIEWRTLYLHLSETGEL